MLASDAMYVACAGSEDGGSETSEGGMTPRTKEEEMDEDDDDEVRGTETKRRK